MAMAAAATGANYQSMVIRLSPTYYYELNETDTAGGAVDTMGNAEPGVYNGDYVNGAPMVGIPGPLAVFNPDDPLGTPVPGLGGEDNRASGGLSVVIGGAASEASGLYSAVLGGTYNAASYNYATAMGGESNTAANNYATVLGGSGNTTSADYEVVP